MIETIEALCAETHNYFIENMYHDDFTIENGNISLPFLVEGQFFAIRGSKFNDGVYIYLDSYIIRDATWDDVFKDNPNWGAITDEEWGTLKHHELIDETFHGGIWAMLRKLKNTTHRMQQSLLDTHQNRSAVTTVTQKLLRKIQPGRKCFLQS